MQRSSDIMGESEQCGNTALTHLSDLLGGHRLPDQDSTTRSIPITKGYSVIVDAADFEWLSQSKWQANVNPSTVYATRKTPAADEPEDHLSRNLCDGGRGHRGIPQGVSEILRRICMSEIEKLKARQRVLEQALREIDTLCNDTIGEDACQSLDAEESLMKVWKLARLAQGEPARTPNSGSNYVADDEIYPTRVEFANGRVVAIKSEDGRVFLGIGMKEKT